VEPVAAAVAAGLGGCAVLLLAAGLVLRAPVLVAPAAAMLGAAYAVSRAVDGGALDLQAPVMAVALLLVCELGYWAHELRTTSPDEPGARARRVAWLALLGVATFVPSVGLLALSDLLRVEGIAVEAAGAAAAACLIGAVLVLANVGRREADA
jgi:hypothetical protein